MEKKKYQLSFQLNVPSSKKEKVEYRPKQKQELDQRLDQHLNQNPAQNLDPELEQRLDQKLDQNQKQDQKPDQAQKEAQVQNQPHALSQKHEQQAQEHEEKGSPAKHAEQVHMRDESFGSDYEGFRSDSIEQDGRWPEEIREEIKKDKLLQQWDFQDTEPLVIDNRQEVHREDCWKEKDELIPFRDRTYSYSYRPPRRSIQPPQEVFWQREEEESKASYLEGPPLSHKVTKRKNWKTGVKKSTRLFLIASSAIIVGLILGIAVLNIFSNLAEEPNQAEASPIGTSSPTLQERLEAQGQKSDTNDQSLAQSSQGAEALDSLAPSHQVGIGELPLPSRTYYFVQAGAFSKFQAAQAMLQEYKDQGYPGTIMEQGDSFHLFVGISSTKQGAQSFRQYYEEQGIESYVKELSLPQASFSSNGQESPGELFISLLAKGDQLLTLLSEFASQGLKEAQHEITAEEWKSLQELHKDYLQTEKEVWAEWNGGERKTGEEMNKQLSTAVNALETYRQQKHRSFLWQSQQALLHYVQAYYELVQAKIG